MTETHDFELDAIAKYVEGMSNAQVEVVRELIMDEVHTLEARFPARLPNDDPGRFEFARVKLTCERRRREVDFLNKLLCAPKQGECYD
jgi:hypothetical protein